MDAFGSALELDGTSRAATPAAAPAVVTDYTALIYGLTWSGDGFAGQPLFLAIPSRRTAGPLPDAAKATSRRSATNRSPGPCGARRLGGGERHHLLRGPADRHPAPAIYDLSLGDAFRTPPPGPSCRTAAPAASVFQPGYVNTHTMLHEIGHALGLKHPFEGDVRLDAAATT